MSIKSEMSTQVKTGLSQEKGLGNTGPHGVLGLLRGLVSHYRVTKLRSDVKLRLG